MRKVGVEEWLIKVVEVVYRHAKSKVRVGDIYSDAFDIRVGVHHSRIGPQPPLFVIVLEASPVSYVLASAVCRQQHFIEELINKTSQ